jgi:hypothetical protein
VQASHAAHTQALHAAHRSAFLSAAREEPAATVEPAALVPAESEDQQYERNKLHSHKLQLRISQQAFQSQRGAG